MRRARHRAPRRSWWLVAAGVVLIAAGASVAYRIVGFLRHSSTTSHALVRGFETGVAAAPRTRGPSPPLGAACPRVAPGATGRARMLLDIPALHEIAPVLEGTANATLAVAVGHLASSPWPGAGGNTVLDAHDVTFFRSIDELHRGDQILLVGPCSTWRYRISASSVVGQGRPVPAGAGAHVVLVTCWPTDALFYTTQRFVVVARLSTVEATRAVLPVPTPLPTVTAALPPALGALHLDATRAGIPLGTLSLDGRYEARWLSSSRPLQASDAATHLLEATIVVARAHDASSWAVMAPGVPLAAIAPLAGQLTWLAPVHVTIVGSRTRVTGAVLESVVAIGGSPRRLVVEARVVAHEMEIGRVLVGAA
ncbi:MAG: class D sortase [Actinomycetota bacterium]|nr:class D sortase [Actinomycetota bacterium]